MHFRVAVAFGLLVIFVSCSDRSSSDMGKNVGAWRPGDARLLGTARSPATRLSGGGYIRAFDTASSFDQVVQTYTESVASQGGVAFRAGTGWRFEADDACAIIHDWKGRDPTDALEIHLSGSVIASLDASTNGYTESTPDDCKDRG